MRQTATVRTEAPARITALRTRLNRPLPWWVLAVAIMSLLSLPAWLFADHLRYADLARDDFVYIADARDLNRFLATLLEPHNTHIVPLFRLWTFALSKIAGRLSALPSALVNAAYLNLVIAALAVHRLVSREARSQAAGLIAMAVLGLSTLNTTVIVWYSAGQALLAGAVVVATLIAVQSWRENRAGWKLLLAGMGVLAAPVIWTGGLAAGPAAAVYLWFDGRRDGRKAAIALALLAIITGGLLFAMVSTRVQEISRTGNSRATVATKAIEALRSTTLAIPEAIVLNNLGLDAQLTGAQGLVLCAVIALCWLRAGPRVPNSLESAGAVITVLSYLMVYYFRGYMKYEDMRTVSWYHAIPDIGAILFVAGWWSHFQSSNGPHANSRPRLSGVGLAAVVVVAVGLLLLHAPRAQRMLIEGAPRMTSEEAAQFPIPELQRLRALLYAEQHAARQKRALVRLEHAERTVQELGAGRDTLRRIFGRVLVPGIHELQMDTDAVSLLALPDSDRRAVNEAALRQALGQYMIVEPEYRPPWLDRPRIPGRSSAVQPTSGE